MYATVFTVVMVLQFTLLTVFHCSVFGMSWNVLGCLGMFLECFWNVLERHAFDLN